jgi:hypothetical protein
MRYLLYGIVGQDSAECPPETSLLAAHGLAAVVSAVEETSSLPTVSSLLAYERVVEAIHARRAVIPLRYGCVMENESAVLRLLENHRQEYWALLARLPGMTEMGIRVLWQACPAVPPASASSPGMAYLASLRNLYHATNTFAGEETRLADQIAGLLPGCFTEQRREVSSSSQRRLLSLYFLTSKTSVEQFRSKARQICPPSGAKILLSGPWPPYNFAGSPE